MFFIYYSSLNLFIFHSSFSLIAYPYGVRNYCAANFWFGSDLFVRKMLGY